MLVFEKIMVQASVLDFDEGLERVPSEFSPEKLCLEDYFPVGKVTFQGLC